MWTTLAFDAVAALFLAKTLATLCQLRWLVRLPPLGAPAGPVRCSVIIAARDEEDRIEGTLRRLFEQRGIEAEFIVVDDRSTDRTPEILGRLALEEKRLKVRRVDSLPAGWLGKCHACHIGARLASGDWLLFTDADCWMGPDVIARAVRLAERDGADHVTLSPGTVVESVWARAWHLMFLSSLINWYAGVNRDRPKAYIGIGAFNLVRSEAYRRCGGYEALRLTVVDDVKLGLLLRRAGLRTRGFLGAGDIECHWGSTVRGMIKIMEKNYFAVLDYRTWLVVGGSLAALAFVCAPVLGLLSGTPAGIAAALSPFTLIWPAVLLARRLGWSWTSAVFVPFMFPVFLYALLHSTAVTLRQGGVRWRDTFYSLETLRAGNVR